MSPPLLLDLEIKDSTPSGNKYGLKLMSMFISTITFYYNCLIYRFY